VLVCLRSFARVCSVRRSPVQLYRLRSRRDFIIRRRGATTLSATPRKIPRRRTSTSQQSRADKVSRSGLFQAGVKSNELNLHRFLRKADKKKRRSFEAVSRSCSSASCCFPAFLLLSSRISSSGRTLECKGLPRVDLKEQLEGN
jgi:hypothetical protein